MPKVFSTDSLINGSLHEVVNISDYLLSCHFQRRFNPTTDIASFGEVTARLHIFIYYQRRSHHDSKRYDAVDIVNTPDLTGIIQIKSFQLFNHKIMQRLTHRLAFTQDFDALHDLRRTTHLASDNIFFASLHLPVCLATG